MKYSSFKLVVISGIVFLAVFTSLDLFNNIFDVDYIPPDSYTYIESADLLYNQLEPHATRPMGYALVLGIPYLFSKSPALSSFIIYNLFVNLVLWIATGLLLFSTLKLFASKKASFIATLFFFICVGNVVQIGLILTETLTTFILTLSSFLFFKYCKNGKPEYLPWAVGLLNVLVIIKPGIIYWALIINVLIFIYLIKKYRALSIKIIYPVVLSFGIIIIQCFSVYQKYGNITVSYIDKVTWYYYLGAEASASSKNISYQQEKIIREQKLSELNWEERYDMCKNDLRHQIQNNAGNVHINYFSNIVENAFGYSLGIRAANTSVNSFYKGVKHILIKLSQLQNAIFISLVILISIYFLLNFKLLNIAVFYSLGSAIYIILTSGVSFWQGDRFHLVFYPMLIIVLLYILSVNFPGKRLLSKQ